MNLFSYLFFVNVAHAEGVDTFVSNVNKLILNPLIGLLFGIALVFFLYGVVEFLMNSETEEGKTMGKKHMLWGVVGLFIMLSVWGILNLVISTIGVKGINPEKGTVELNKYEPEIDFTK